MDIVPLIRKLVDIESTTANEGQVGYFLLEELRRLGYNVQRMVAEGERANVYATAPQQPQPKVAFSTHMDTVPPFIASSEDERCIYGRGSCDAKGIIAAQIAAAERLREEGIYVGLLFLVGEERDSLGAKVANQQPNSCKFLINGEPTENRVATASKGALRVELTATGRMAHSAYPELGESAIDKLLNALDHIRKIRLPHDDVLGPSTLNIGTIQGGRAPNVIPDEAKAEIFIRLVGDSASTKEALARAGAAAGVEMNFVLEIPAVRLKAVEGLPTTVVAYTTDIPAFGGAWGQPLLLGPGTIHVAHTLEERVPKKQLREAVELYQHLVRQLQAQ